MGAVRLSAQISRISTHALHEEGDHGGGILILYGFQFLPTPSTRRATLSTARWAVPSPFLPTPSTRRATATNLIANILGNCISTHALHEEGDVGIVSGAPPDEISTHALHEEGDRNPAELFEGQLRISTHALHEEGDDWLP